MPTYLLMRAPFKKMVLSDLIRFELCLLVFLDLDLDLVGLGGMVAVEVDIFEILITGEKGCPLPFENTAPSWRHLPRSVFVRTVTCNEDRGQNERLQC